MFARCSGELHPEPDRRGGRSTSGDDQSRFSPTDQSRVAVRAVPAARCASRTPCRRASRARSSRRRPSRASAAPPRPPSSRVQRAAAARPCCGADGVQLAGGRPPRATVERPRRRGRSRALRASARRARPPRRRAPTTSTSLEPARSAIARLASAQPARRPASSRRSGSVRIEPERGWPTGRAEPARRCAQLVADDHLDRAGDRDRGERAEDAGELGADEHRDEHGERRELHRAPVDHRLQEVVLELLVDDHEDQRATIPAGTRVQERDERRR